MQGYTPLDITTFTNIDLLIRATPFFCSMLGLLGVLLKSPVYLVSLGLLTTIGAFTDRSFYDYIYLYLFKHIFPLGDVPRHKNARRFGCGIGACLFISGGIGFYINNLYLSYIPTLFIIVLAFIAATTQWCFASTLYNFLFGKNEKCC
jgi:hypothetical protein